MNPNTFFRFALLLFSIVFAGVAVFGQSSATDQPGAESAYEVVLNVIVGSNESGESALPQDLRPVAARLKNVFAFSNYRLDHTLYGRVSTNGNFSYKSVAKSLGPSSDGDVPTFLDWDLQRLVRSADGRSLTALSFHFGARVPIKYAGPDGGEAAKPVYSVNYEQIGLSATQLTLSLNTPTLVGTLSLPRTDGTLFLVLTVRPAI